jgi:hypothetical protein
MYSQLKNLILSINGDKMIVIDNKRLFFYNKISISSGHFVYVPPVTKYAGLDGNVDEVIYLPESFKNELLGIKFIFTNTLNLQGLTKNNDPIRTAISNVIYTIQEFKYIRRMSSIIIKEVSDNLFPAEEIKIKGDNTNMRFFIENYVDQVLSTYCTRAEQRSL